MAPLHAFSHDPETIRRITVHRKRQTLFGLGLGPQHYIFLVLYALAAQQCLSTVGQPYAAALAHAQARKAAVESAKLALGVSSVNASAVGGEAAAGQLPPPPPPEDDFDPWAEESAPAAAAPSAAATASNGSWGEVVSFGAGGEEEDEDEKEPPLPSPLLPAFWALVLSACVALLHALSQLAQHWSMGVKVALRYSAAPRVEEGATLLVTPPLHQGKAALVPLHAFNTPAGQPGLFFIFQRQRYELEREAAAPGAAPLWAVRQLPYRVSEPLSFYLNASGLDPSEAEERPGTLRARFGRNDFHVPIPLLRELFLEQLLGPVTQFQLFSALLWVLDEYWKYALFNGGMILMFEATTALSRLKSLQTLRGMGSKARSVFVLRGGAWVLVGSDLLLPGDIISLTTATGGAAAAAAAAAGALAASPGAAPGVPEEEPLVPCDCLILSGSAVANEASLTGESIPQLKEAARAEGVEGGVDRLDLTSNAQRVCVLFSGTSLMRHSGGGGGAGRPAPPDGGVVCYVLRTGFASSQGALMRMIEFSQEQVTGDSRETLILLFILLAFALASAGHVLRTGLREGKRSQYELLLRCVFILTSVVPPELPMQTALAVNTSLMALHRVGVFCTEPYRIPLAGKVDSCLFDKTGTLTTDKLVAQGIMCWEGGARAPTAPARPLVPVQQASLETCVVMAGCHSLLEIDGKLVGDPIEVEALRSARWTFSPASNTATPLPAREGEAARPWPASRAPAVTILHRFHFSSALQRMSVLARVSGLDGQPGAYALVKGSAEAIGRLLEQKPEGYEAAYKPLAARGMRVLALAMKPMGALGGARVDELPRETVESGLRFVGFVAFSCRVRQDTARVVAKLLAGGTQVAMVTGDDPLTALHVAREVGICKPDALRKPPLLLTEKEGGGVEWVAARVDLGEAHRVPFSAAALPALVSAGAELCVSGDSLRAATAAEPALWAHMSLIRVFARMKPSDKECVLKELRAAGRYTFMCGDGANDVGALKQAHVGLALLSGFGDANTVKASKSELASLIATAERVGDLEVVKSAKQAAAEKAAAEAEAAVKLREKQEAWKDEVARDRAEMVEMQKVMLEEAMKAHAGEKWGAMKAMKTCSVRLMEETRRRNEARHRKFGGSPFGATPASLSMMEGLEDGELPRVKLGDASIAAPFTSKVPSICSAVDIIRQGRCALVNTAQQQQILALNCLISAYSLSALYLDGIKSGEAQMIATGVLLTVASLSFSFTKPVEELSPVPPLRSIFHPAYGLSLVGQLLIHLACMVYSFHLAKTAEPSGPGSCAACTPAKLADGGFLSILAKQIESELAKQAAASDAPTTTGYKFTPSLLNTVVFLVTTAQQVSVLFVNYKGRPFMQSVSENPAFMWSVMFCCVGAFACAFETVPELNSLLKLVSMPSDDFRWRVLGTLALSTLGAFVWDRLCLYTFARHVFKASLEASRPDPWQMLLSTRRFMLISLTFVVVLASNMNFIVLLVVYQAYKAGLYKAHVPSA